MSKEMTAEEYLKNATYNNVERFGDAVTPESCESYGDLRAKEAVREFAKWFRAFMLSQGLIGCADILLAYAKQKGVEI